MLIFFIPLRGTFVIHAVHVINTDMCTMQLLYRDTGL